jgi:hypothetical protein
MYAYPALTPVISKANEISGSQTGSHRRQTPGDAGRRARTISAVSWHNKLRRATFRDRSVASYKRGGAGSNPAAPTRFLQLDGLFETPIGGQVTTAGNHRCILPDGGRVPSCHGSIPLRPPRAVRRRQAPPALKRHTGLKDPRRPASRAAGRQQRRGSERRPVRVFLRGQAASAPHSRHRPYGRWATAPHGHQRCRSSARTVMRIG